VNGLQNLIYAVFFVRFDLAERKDAFRDCNHFI